MLSALMSNGHRPPFAVPHRKRPPGDPYLVAVAVAVAAVTPMRVQRTLIGGLIGLPDQLHR